MSQDLWYAVKVRTRSEWLVESQLRNKGYAPFLPTYKSNRRWSDRIKTMELPLFPGYLFCQFDVLKRLPILTTLGVSSIVGIGRVPEPIDDAEIEAIRTVIRSSAAYGPCPYVTVGQCVRVEYGSLYGLTGLVTNVRNETRLIISVDMLMRSISVEVDQAWVRPIGTTPRNRFQLPAPGRMPSASVALR